MAADGQGRTDDALELRFAADPFAVRAALSAVRERLGGRMSAEQSGMLELTLAEVLNNIVEHAYADQPAGDIRLRLAKRRDGLECLIEDRGRAMPGLCLPLGRMPEPDLPTEHLAEGGWGWALIRALTTDLAYERAGCLNRVTFCIPTGRGLPPG